LPAALIDAWRADSARRRRENAVALNATDHTPTDVADTDRDDTPALLFLCCHSALSPPAQLRDRRCNARFLTAEAIRLTRLLHRLLPDETEVAGLLALMLLVPGRLGRAWHLTRE
jgi:predicted RNA polymerase sigma factor